LLLARRVAPGRLAAPASLPHGCIIEHDGEGKISIH